MATGGGQGGSGGYAGAGTVAINVVKNTTEAKIIGTDINDATGDVKLVGTDNTSIYSFAGAFAYGKKAGLGAAIAVNTVFNTTRAAVESSKIYTTGGFEAKAEEGGTIVTLAVAGAGSEKIALAGSVALNLFDNDIDAHVINSTINAGGAVALTAKDKEISVALGGGIAVSKGSGAVGAAIGVNLIFNEITSHVESSTIYTTAAFADKDAISVSAVAEEVLVSVTLGGAGAEKFALGGSVSANVIMNTVEAKVASGVTGKDAEQNDIITESDLDARGDIGISASDSTTAVVVAGGFAGSSKAAVGIAASAIYIENDVLATVSDSDVTSSEGEVNIDAGVGKPASPASLSGISVGTSGVDLPTTNAATVVNVTVAGSGAGKLAVSAAVSTNIINNTIEAAIVNGSTVIGHNGVSLSATDKSEINAIALGVAGSGGAGVGIALSGNAVTNTVGSYIKDSTVLAGVNEAGTIVANNTADVSLTSVSSSIIRALGIGVSGGSKVAVSVSALGNVVTNTCRP